MDGDGSMMDERNYGNGKGLEGREGQKYDEEMMG